MSKVHITLVGGQPAPVYHGIVATKPDKVVFIYSDESREVVKSGIDKNETDIIVNTGTKLLFVECKTQIAKPNDIDKFRSVVKTYGGMGSKGLFVTDAKMSEVANKKCEENGVLSFSFSNSLSPERDLSFLLDCELSNINTK